MRRNAQCFTTPVWTSAIRLALACAVVFALILSSAESARAAFPGTNGEITFTHCQAGSDCGSNASYQIWLMEADGSGQHQLIPEPGFFAGHSTFSADGRWVAFQRCNGDPAKPLCGIAKVDAHGQNLTQLTPLAPDPIGGGGDDYPAFSPDGTQIVFEDLQNRIAVMGADGSNLHELTGGDDDGEPKFSPDGSKILFERLTGGEFHLYLMNPDGSGLHPLTSGAGEMDPDFFPDGNSIAFIDQTGGTRHLARIDIDGNNRTPLTMTAAGDGFPAVAPDGTRVAFDRYGSSSPPYTSNVFTTTFDGASPTPLTSSGGDWGASWGRLPTPSIDSPPTIAGAAQVGHALTVTAGPGTWGGTASFQWLRCPSCSVIGSATGDSYKPTNADIGKTIEVRQTQSSAGGSVTADSVATGAIQPEPGASIGRRAKLRRGKIVVRLTCGAAQSGVCDGRLSLRGTRASKARTVSLGNGSYRIAPGTSKRVTVRLSRRGRALFKQAPKVRVKATAVTNDDAGNSTTKKRSFTLGH
jgi:dipeptidyl aminopeptidase/acylaminoacyl peptidase